MAHRDEYTYEEEQQILLDLEEKAYEEQLITAQEMDLCNNCIELECENHGVVCPHYRADMRGKDNDKVN